MDNTDSWFIIIALTILAIMIIFYNVSKKTEIKKSNEIFDGNYQIVSWKAVYCLELEFIGVPPIILDDYGKTQINSKYQKIFLSSNQIKQINWVEDEKNHPETLYKNDNEYVITLIKK